MTVTLHRHSVNTPELQLRFAVLTQDRWFIDAVKVALMSLGNLCNDHGLWIPRVLVQQHKNCRQANVANSLQSDLMNFFVSGNECSA